MPARDQDIVRDAVQQGLAMPLTNILKTVRAAHPGSVLDVRLRRAPPGTIVYDVVVLSASGRTRTISVDARRNRIISLEQP